MTHSVTFLSEVDQIVVIKGGKIAETGTFEELMQKKGTFADFIKQYLSHDTE